MIRGIAMTSVGVDEAFMSMLSNSTPSVTNRCVMIVECRCNVDVYISQNGVCGRIAVESPYYNSVVPRKIACL